MVNQFNWTLHHKLEHERCLRGVNINNRKRKRARNQPSARAGARASSKRARKSLTSIRSASRRTEKRTTLAATSNGQGGSTRSPSFILGIEYAAWLATRFGSAFAKQYKAKFCYGTIVCSTSKPGCFMVKYDDGTQLESSQNHLQHTTVKFAKRKRN